MSEITVASTTDTQQSVNQAAGLDGRHGQPSADFAAATGEEESQGGRPQALGHRPQQSSGEEELGTEGTSSESAGRHDETATESETGEQQNRLTTEDTEEHGGPGDRGQKAQNRNRQGSAEKRIKSLTRRVYEQQEELDALRERVVGQQPGAPAERAFANSGAEDGRPVPTSFRSYEQYIEALADWKAGQRVQQQKQAELVQAEQERTREVFDTYNEAAKSARVKYEDFEEVVGRRDLKIPQAAQVAIIEAGELGPDIAYYLGKHPEVCQELAQMSPMRAVARIGQIESQVIRHGEPTAGHRPQATGHREQEKAASTATRTVTTSAPAPITPVGGGSSRTSVPLGELPYRDYKRLRDQEERARR